MTIPNQVASLFDYLKERLGKNIIYKRLKQFSYDPSSGTTKEWWEIVETKCIRINASERARKMQGGVLQEGDILIAIKSASFTKQPGESAPWPSLGDELVIDGETWTTDLDGKVFCELDPSGTVFFIGVRRKPK